MKLTNWFLNFDFSGRGRRSHSWANWGAWTGVWIVVSVIASAIGGAAAPAGGGNGIGAAVSAILVLAVLVASTIDSMAMTFRRAHDTGRTGWIWLLLLIPFVNLLAFYWLLIEDSQQGPNKYGPAVKTFYEPVIPAA